MKAKPIWFGPTPRPLFGMLHVPDGNVARAGVVLCSPLGREDLFAHSAFRMLAQYLEQQGMAVLRFDYDGTGDSAGSQRDEGRVAAWSESTQAAVDLMRSAGPPVVAAVGMRIGATLAALEATRSPLDALVLWDPCRSGRVFLREAHALHAVSVGGTDPDDGSVQTPGFRYDPQTAADLKALDITATDGPMAERILALSRPDRQHDAKLQARLSTAGHLEQSDALGQHDLLVVDGQVNPDLVETITGLVTWLSSVAPPEPAPFDLTPFDRLPTSAVVAHDARSRPIVERAVYLGAAELSGVITEIEGASNPTTVVCFNTAKSRHLGPSRLWVELAREWAGCGLRTLRVDMSGIGDSGTHPGQARDIFYPPEAAADIEDVARFVDPDDSSHIVFVGLCSGAYHAVLAGLSVRAQGVCAINPIFTYRPMPVEPTPAPASAEPAPPSRIRRIAGGVADHRALKALRGELPDGAWRLAYRLGLRRSPVESLERLVAAGSDVLVIVGRDEAVRIKRGAVHILRKLSRTDRLQLTVIDDLEHAMLGADDPRRVGEIVYRHVRDRFGQSEPAADPADPRHDPMPFGVADGADTVARIDEASRS
jgi:alpha/beta superfamily hydrolase